MADCFNLSKAVELVEGLRRHIKLSREGRIYVDIGSEIFCRQAADTIEQLLTENAKLKAERDAAVADLKDLAYCTKCLHENKYPIKNPCCCCKGDMWEWRGVQKADT